MGTILEARSLRGNAMSAPVDAVPRDYNFAADILKRNLDAGRGDKVAYIDHRGSYSYAALAVAKRAINY